MVFIDQLTSLLYNDCCKIFVKGGEEILRLFIVEDEKEICDTVAKVCMTQDMRWIPAMMGKKLLQVS